MINVLDFFRHKAKRGKEKKGLRSHVIGIACNTN